MIRMSVAGIALDPDSTQPIVLLNDDAKVRGLPIWIGALEARAISLALRGVKGARPMTHDLMVNVIQALDSDVQHVEIDKLDSSTYRATIKVTSKGRCKRGKDRLIDARPSDAIALALAVGCPIFVSEQLEFVIDEGAQQDEQFREFLKGLKASDFGQVTIPGSISSSSDDTCKNEQTPISPDTVSESPDLETRLPPVEEGEE